MRNQASPLLLAICCACPLLGSPASSAAEPAPSTKVEPPAVSKVEPELAPDKDLLASIAALPDNTWLKLPPLKVTGDLDWLGPKDSIRQVGPRGRDYSNKAAWMPDRKRAIFAGGGHNVHPLNDVWEYDLASNTWVCLYGADAPAQGKPPEWMKDNLVIRDGALQTKRGGPPRLSHTFDGWSYDSDRRVAFMPESLRGAVFVDSKTVAEALGAEEFAKWKPAPFFLTFDPYARKWGYVTENAPKCGRDPSARYIAHLKSWWVSSGGSMGLYDPEKKATRVLSTKGGGGGYGSSTAYDPDTRSVVVVVPPDKDGKAVTWVYSINTETWKTAQPSAPTGGCSASGYFDYDTRAKRCVLYTTRPNPGFWVYDVAANEWTPVEIKGEPPAGGYVVGYYDPERDVLVHYNSKDVWVGRLKKAKQ
ncbi:MAG TPA: hypothetical protein PK280_04435 [Planctomycetota bacterium]|nr:hypothetical protein [Planctomycetota bacterium]